MSGAARIGIVWAAKRIVNTVVTLSVLLLLIYGCYAIWDSHQVRSAASSLQYERYKPSGQNPLSFQELQDINPEVFSWLTVYGTNIDYPVAQGDNDNNIKYVNTDALGRYSISGAIFMDYKNKKDYSNFKNIIYGHHMDKNTMFGEIGDFVTKSYFDARRYGSLHYGEQEHGIEFFAFAHTDAYDEAFFNVESTDRNHRESQLDYLISLAIHIREDVTVTTEDRLVLLSTCSARSTNGRDILIGKITDEVYENLFKEENADKPDMPAIDELAGLWAGASLLTKICIVGIPVSLIILAVFLAFIKWRRSQKEFEELDAKLSQILKEIECCKNTRLSLIDEGD